MANLRPSHDTGARGRYPAKIQDMTMFSERTINIIALDLDVKW